MKKIIKKDVLLTPSLYTLLLYILLKNDWDKSDYVLHSRIPQIIRTNLQNVGACVYTDCTKERGNTIFDKLKQNISYIKYLQYSKNFEYINVYGNDEFYLSMKYRQQGIKIIEDGPYFNDKKILKKRRMKIYAGLLNYWFYWIYKNYVPWGFDNYVTVFYHTSINKLSDEIAKKGVMIDLHQLWNNKSKSEQEQIMHIFGVDPEFVTNIDKYKTILVTQVMPIPDADKIEMYKSLLLENGICQSKLLVKTHYAERINYRAIFPEAHVIDTPVPAQLLDVLGCEVDMAMTICSSAIFAFVKPKTKIIFKGTEFDERLKNFYGVIRLEDFVNKN